MDITISLQIKMKFDGNKKVSVGNVATVVKGLGLEQKVTEAMIQKADEEFKSYRKVDGGDIEKDKT